MYLSVDRVSRTVFVLVVWVLLVLCGGLSVVLGAGFRDQYVTLGGVSGSVGLASTGCLSESFGRSPSPAAVRGFGSIFWQGRGTHLRGPRARASRGEAGRSDPCGRAFSSPNPTAYLGGASGEGCLCL